MYIYIYIYTQVVWLGVLDGVEGVFFLEARLEFSETMGLYVAGWRQVLIYAWQVLRKSDFNINSTVLCS